jgi:hypothetical protein
MTMEEPSVLPPPHSESRPRSRVKGLLSAHLVIIATHVGVVVALLSLALLARAEASLSKRAVLYRAVADIELFLLWPLVALTVTTGVVLGLRRFTHRGFVTLRWLIVKQLIVVAIAVVVAVLIGPVTPQAATAAEHASGDLNSLSTRLISGLVVYAFGVVTIIVIAVWKPWGTRRRLTADRSSVA